MPDLGLMAGIGEGLKSGLMAYTDMRKLRNQEAQTALQNQMQQKQYAAGLEEKGLQEDTANPGKFTLSPLFLQRQKMAQQMELEKERFNKNLELHNKIIETGAQNGLNYQVGPNGQITGAQPIPGAPGGLLKGPLSKLNEGQASKLAEDNRKQEDAVRGLKQTATLLQDPDTDSETKYERALGALGLLKDQQGAGGLRGQQYKDATALISPLPNLRKGLLNFGADYGELGKIMIQKADEMAQAHDTNEARIPSLVPGYQPHMISSGKSAGMGAMSIDPQAAAAELARRRSSR